MRIGRRAHAGARDLQSLQDEVHQQLDAPPVGAVVRQVTRAANAWSSAAVADGQCGSEVSGQLDSWAVAFGERSSAVLVRVGLRLHGASHLRFH